MENSVLNIKKKIIPILKRHDVKRAAIFGSYAREEENKKSDIDVLIEFKEESNKGLLDLVGLKLNLEKALNRKVDIVEYPAIKPLLRNRILREQIPIL